MQVLPDLSEEGPRLLRCLEMRLSLSSNLHLIFRKILFLSFTVPSGFPKPIFFLEGESLISYELAATACRGCPSSKNPPCQTFLSGGHSSTTYLPRDLMSHDSYSGHQPSIPSLPPVMCLYLCKFHGSIRTTLLQYPVTILWYVFGDTFLFAHSS